MGKATEVEYSLEKYVYRLHMMRIYNAVRLKIGQRGEGNGSARLPVDCNKYFQFPGFLPHPAMMQMPESLLQGFNQREVLATEVLPLYQHQVFHQVGPPRERSPCIIRVRNVQYEILFSIKPSVLQFFYMSFLTGMFKSTHRNGDSGERQVKV